MIPIGWYSKRRGAGGFTLLELLLVVVILGIIAAVLVPNIGAGLEGARLSTAARSALQAARYARTMALLNQTEVTLTFDPASGKINVRASPGGGFTGNPMEETHWERLETGRDLDLYNEDNSTTNISAAQLTSQNFAEEVNAEYICEKVKFKFLGYQDSLDDDNQHPEDGQIFNITFRSNGTCRPFAVRVVPDDEEDGDWIELGFDITGTGRVIDATEK